MELIKYKYRPYDFRSYGLNEKRNMLRSGDTYELNNETELNEFLVNTLQDIECPESAFFAYAFDGTMYSAIKTYLSYDEVMNGVSEIHVLHNDNDDEDDYDYDFDSDDDEYESDNEAMFTAIDIYKSVKKDDFDYFATLDDEYRFCCYGLMMQQSDGKWRVI